MGSRTGIPRPVYPRHRSFPRLRHRRARLGSIPLTSARSSPNYSITYVSGVLTVNPALATVQSVIIRKIKTRKHKTSEVIVIQFSEAMNQSSVQNLSNYSLATIPAKKKQKSKAVLIASATYNASAFTVNLTTRKPLVLNPPLKLTINAAGLLDSLGRPLDGNHDGLPGGNGVVTISKGARPSSNGSQSETSATSLERFLTPTASHFFPIS